MISRAPLLLAFSALLAAVAGDEACLSYSRTPFSPKSSNELPQASESRPFSGPYPNETLAEYSKRTAVNIVPYYGFIRSPPTRVFLCKLGANTGCGAITYKPQSVQSTGNFPIDGPPDGKIPGGGDEFPELNEYGKDRWVRFRLPNYLAPYNETHRVFTIEWFPNTLHRPANFSLYASIGYDGSEPLTRAKLRYAGTATVPSGFCLKKLDYAVPTDLFGGDETGTLLLTWTIGESSSAFYAVMDYETITRNDTLDCYDPEECRAYGTVSNRCDCRSFFACWWSKVPLLVRCLEGFVYNPVVETCDYPTNAYLSSDIRCDLDVHRVPLSSIR